MIRFLITKLAGRKEKSFSGSYQKNSNLIIWCNSGKNEGCQWNSSVKDMEAFDVV